MRKIIVFFLSIVMILSFSCLGFAEDESFGEPTRVSEEIGLRELNSDTYLMSDGSYDCVVYADDKYYEDEEGKLSVIDNSIVEETFETENNKYDYSNKANSSKMHFSKEAPEICVDYKGEKLEFGLIECNETHAVLGGDKEIEKISDYDLTGENCIMYPGVFENTDLVYQVKNGVLKEYMIIRNSNAPYTYTFKYNNSDYTFKDTKNGVNIYNNDGELAFELGQLFAVDSNEIYTDTLTYDINDNGDETCITFTIDPEYINSPDRAFPILIDPTTTITGANKTADTYVSSKNPTINYSNSDYLKTGKSDAYSIRRSLIKFNIPSSISNGRVSSAELRIRRYGGVDPTTVKERRITGSWSTSGVNWNNKPGTASSGNSFIHDTGSWFKANVTSVVKMWVYGEKANHGFELRDNNEGDTEYWTNIHSSDSDADKTPELVINYTPHKWAKLISVVPDNSEDRSSWMNQTKTNLNSCTSISNSSTSYSSFTVSQIKDYMTDKGNAVFICRANGGAQMEQGSQIGTLIITDETSSTGLTLFTSLDLYNLDLSNLKLVVFLGTGTGEGGLNAETLPRAAVNSGAKAAIGFKGEIDNDEANSWIIAFSNLMKEGKTVKKACETLKTEFNDSGLEKYIICGNTSTTLS